MSAIIPGYEYDIFISYRQKDNKYDGWVTEFVDHLKKELEATFKEDISVYFDINPHDGLLDTYDVDESLREKLKCLICIPIVSRTYCDPKSYAWNREFMAFVELASRDSFGLKVRLPNGNVANRILPIRIHELEPEDVALLEEYLGFIRPVDFIYHSQGVNRPLRHRDDDVQQNVKQLIYRDQINKVANAVDEIIKGMRKELRHDVKEPEQSISKTKVVLKREKKTKEKRDINRKPFKVPRWAPRLLIAIMLTLAIVSGNWWFRKQNKIEWARLTQIPAIQKLVDENFVAPTRAFDMATEIEKIIPGDTTLEKLWPKIAVTFPLKTAPEGVKVYWKDYNQPESAWKYIGVTPINDARIPIGYLRMKFEKPGIHTLYYAGPPSSFGSLEKEISSLKLDSAGSVPEDMVRIPTRTSSMLIVGLEQYGGKKVKEFLVDKFEVTNKEFKRFVDSGGYSDQNYWKFPIYVKGLSMTWNEAVKLFVDKTGKPGPSTWEVGTYPDGKEEYPVTGVSLYEAKAYAEFVKKKLPSVYQWSVIAQTGRTKDIIPLSNFNESSLVPTGSLQGITTFGVYDIAGNAREWCLNEGNEPDQYYILGGGFNDPTYAYNCAYTQSSTDRSVSNGFRCVKELPGDSSNQELSGRIELAFRDYEKEKPVDEKTFNFFLRQFDYDKSNLNAEVSKIDGPDIWNLEKATVDAAYNKERMDIWIFLPKNAAPPYQPVIFFPGSGVIVNDKFSPDEIKRFDFIIKSGRAIIYPILRGTFGRRDGLESDLQEETVFYKDHVIMWRKDIGRTIDYIEERPDMLHDKTGYFGYSWGGFMGGLIPAVETRIKAIVLLVGGMQMNRSLPEVDQINFLPRVHQPVLMLNGKHDMFFPELTSQKPMFEFLGTKIKEMKVYNEGHLVPRQDLVNETLKWYDQNLGEIKK